MIRFLGILAFSQLMTVALSCSARSASSVRQDNVGIGDLGQALGGQAKITGSLKSSSGGEDRIRKDSDLDCKDWNSRCRWRNEEEADKMDYAVGRGLWDVTRGNIGFGTKLPNERAEGAYVVTGTGQLLSPEENAMIVSDPVPCQDGDGQLSFKYWTTEGAVVRVCTREPGNGATYIYCSPEINGGDPGPVTINVPGVNRPFEMVIEARGFTFNKFGLQGGLVVIDDVKYQAKVGGDRCDDRGDAPNPPTDRIDNGNNNGNNEVRPNPPRGNTNELTQPTQRFGNDPLCSTVFCTFDKGNCIKDLERNGFDIKRGPFGNRHTGIREPHKKNSAYAVANGAGAQSPKLEMGGFELDQDKLIEFCYYRPSAESNLEILTVRNGREQRVFKTPEFDFAEQHKWTCERLLLERGKYDGVDFVVEGLRNKHSFLGIDDVVPYNAATPNTPLCS